MATPKRRRFQFSLMSLFVVITIAALSVGLLSWLRLQFEGELNEFDLRSGPAKMLLFHCANTRDANELADNFDNEVFLAIVRESLGTEVKDTPLALYRGTTDNGFFVQCEFTHWGKLGDKRNPDIHQAIDNAGRSYAANHSSVVKFEHSP